MNKVMKTVIVLVVILALVLCLCACGNYNLCFNYQYTNAYVRIGDEWVDLEIKSWTSTNTQYIQITLLDDTVMLLSCINCILYNGELPEV